MLAFHSNWTKPFFVKHKKEAYFIEDYEILTTMLSALMWRKYNGGIKLVTDSVGAEYYDKLGMRHIWNDGIDVIFDKIIDKEIDPNIFWAAGKIYALREQREPSAMIDTDFIIWKPMWDQLVNEKLVVAHREEINDVSYPDKGYFDMDITYAFPEGWDWSILPCNTAFAYISDMDFKDTYTKSSIDFMKHVKPNQDTITNMVFAEQRIISMCAHMNGVYIKSLLDMNR